MSPLLSFFYEYGVTFWVTVVTWNFTFFTPTIDGETSGIELGSLAGMAFFVISHDE